MTKTVVNYTDQMEPALIANGEGKDVLALYKLDGTEKRFDGKRGSYALEYRWLSQECERPEDEAYVCVKGMERQMYSKRELVELGVLTTSGKVNTENLFENFSIL